MNHLLLSIGLCLLATLGTLGVHPPIAVRFHHLHYRVPDPGDALGDAAEAFEGTRTILQGLGVGVRVGNQYLLFDRQSGTDPRRSRRSAPDAYRQAARWLSGQGIVVEPASLADTAVARGWSGWDARSRGLCRERSCAGAGRDQDEALDRQCRSRSFHARLGARRRDRSRYDPAGRVVVSDARRRAVADRRVVPDLFDGPGAYPSTSGWRVPPGCLSSASARRRVVRIDDGRSRP